MSPREQPEQQAPPVQRLRIRYAKRGRLRFTSHRDFSRAFERAVFRARVPMAYSSGFNPHPRISYAGAAPTGSASEAEYLEIALAETVDPAAIHRSLDEAMPDGLDVLEVVESPGGGLADLLEASRWTVDLPATPLAEGEPAVAGSPSSTKKCSIPASRRFAKIFGQSIFPSPTFTMLPLPAMSFTCTHGKRPGHFAKYASGS